MGFPLGRTGSLHITREEREMPSVPVVRRPMVALLLLAAVFNQSSGATIPEHIMNDPSFLQCLSQHSTADPVDYVAIVASCYGFVGRPRFGKRSDPLESSRPETLDYFW